VTLDRAKNSDQSQHNIATVPSPPPPAAAAAAAAGVVAQVTDACRPAAGV